MACARILLVFGCFGTGPAGVRVFRNRTKALFFMGSKGDVKEFFGMRFAWRVLLLGWSRRLLCTWIVYGLILVHSTSYKSTSKLPKQAY